MNAYVITSRRAPEASISRDLIGLCVWSVGGLALSVLLCAAGFGAEIARALAV